ncbi:30S ribosome-binding factor RbfA [bacterium]|nr:30S ribosome-binding factor RbfA [bacterium]
MKIKNKKNFHFQHIQSQILLILNETLRDEIYDEKIKLATFTATKLTNDYSYCTVYVDTFDRTKIDEIILVLNKAKGVFRTALAKKLTIRKVPQLIFINDCTIDQSKRINEIIDNLHKK